MTKPEITPSKKEYVGFIYLFIGIFTWATIELTFKLIQDDVSSITTNFFRMLFGGLFLLCFVFINGRSKSFKYFVRKYAKYYIPSAALGLVFGQLMFLYGVSLTKASISATIFSSNPIVISSFMMLFKGEKKLVTRIIGIFVGFFGVLLIITEFNFNEFFSSNNILGNLLVFSGMCLWCIHVIVGKLLLKRNFIDPETNEKIEFTSMDFNTITFLVAAIINLPFLFIPSNFVTLTSISSKGWLGMVYLGLVTGGIGYLLFFKGLKLMEASKGINVFYFKPIIATILSYFLLQEIPNNYLYIGIVIEVIALILVSKEEKKSMQSLNLKEKANFNLKS